MSVFERITTDLRSGMVLTTPVERVQFTINSIDAEKGMVVFSVGAKTPVGIPRKCWNGIPDFLRGKGWVLIGSRYDTAPIGTLQEYLDQWWSEGKTHTSDAGYVASVLEYLKIVEVDHCRPSKVKLK